MPNIKLIIEYTPDDFTDNYEGSQFVIVNNKIGRITNFKGAGHVEVKFFGGELDDRSATFTVGTLDFLDARFVRLKSEVEQYTDNLMAYLDQNVEVEIIF